MADQYHFHLADRGIRYSVRKSPRAKYVRLKVSSHEGLVVVVPRGFDTRQVPGIIREWVPWIRRAFEKVPPTDSRKAILPQSLSLLSIGENWTVRVENSAAKKVALVERPDRIVNISTVSGDCFDSFEKLRIWVRRKAEKELLPWLGDTARHHGFNYVRGIVRHQKTRWGSCSIKGTISLNMKLLFLPPELVEYIILHELCHTVHMNHSQSFWELVEQHMPDFRVRDLAMKNASRYIPLFMK